VAREVRGKVGDWATIVQLEGRNGLALHGDGTRIHAKKSLLYEGVIDMVDKLITARGLEPGDQLPTQADLAELANVSLITVRRALEELERVGRVRRQQGLGTFVAQPRIIASPVRPGSLLGTIDRKEQRTRRITTVVVGVNLGYPSSDIAAALQIEGNSEVWKVSRHRVLDKRPLIVETSVIPVALAPGLDAHERSLEGSLYELLADRYGLVDSYEEQLLEVISPTREERQVLCLSARSQVVRLRGRSVDQRGTVFDCFEQLYPAADFIFSIAGSTSRHIVEGPDARDWTVSPRADQSRSRRRARE
jgi:DNA-binding GntR family transcriptional regulator